MLKPVRSLLLLTTTALLGATLSCNRQDPTLEPLATRQEQNANVDLASAMAADDLVRQDFTQTMRLVNEYEQWFDALSAKQRQQQVAAFKAGVEVGGKFADPSHTDAQWTTYVAGLQQRWGAIRAKYPQLERLNEQEQTELYSALYRIASQLPENAQTSGAETAGCYAGYYGCINYNRAHATTAFAASARACYAGSIACLQTPAE